MKLSTRARYGLKALIDLGLHSENETVSLQSIAERQDISVSYLEQLMGKLRKAGIVKSIRGAQGGYRLGRPPEEISVGDILRALEGDVPVVGVLQQAESVFLRQVASHPNVRVVTVTEENRDALRLWLAQRK